MPSSLCMTRVVEVGGILAELLVIGSLSASSSSIGLEVEGIDVHKNLGVW